MNIPYFRAGLHDQQPYAERALLAFGQPRRLMAHDSKDRGKLKVLRVSVTNENEVRGWAKLFRVTADQLLRAVAAVGTNADQVEAFLYKDTEPMTKQWPHEDPHER